MARDKRTTEPINHTYPKSTFSLRVMIIHIMMVLKIESHTFLVVKILIIHGLSAFAFLVNGGGKNRFLYLLVPWKQISKRTNNEIPVSIIESQSGDTVAKTPKRKKIDVMGEAITASLFPSANLRRLAKEWSFAFPKPAQMLSHLIKWLSTTRKSSSLFKIKSS